jgi:predicted acyl esterase
VTDLRKFYDYYMKGINNDWKFTPRVRLSVLNAGGLDTVNRPESEFPLQRQQAYKLYLDASSMELKQTLPEDSTQVSYKAVDGRVQFRFPIPSNTSMEFTGYMKLRLWVEAQGSNDMDIWTSLWKYDTETGTLLESMVVDVGRLDPDPEKERAKLKKLHAEDPKFAELYFDSGPIGMLRASHRELDEAESTTFNPVYAHRKEQLLEPGQVVPLDIAFWPYGMTCHPGEEIRLTIAGYCLKEHLRLSDRRPDLRNKGQHIIHTGGKYDSYLLLPLIPQ